jgi:hypothetical protein
MSFSSTTPALLTRIGLVREYTNVTSNTNYKAMLWKSIRNTSDVYWVDVLPQNNIWYTSLGLNSSSKLWVDNYDVDGWAVLDRSSNGTLTVHAKQSKVIDTDLINRLIIQDGDNFINHQLYDPLNLKMPGAIVSKLEYIAWNDPASYDTVTSSDIWLDEKIGKIWWDTDLARFYRYNDYGDRDGILNVNYVKKYWGKIVDGSTVVVKKWTKSRILPVETATYNTKKYYDEVADKEVTDYFYWSSTSDVVVEIAMFISAGGPKNKFIPVGPSSVLISNNATSYDSETINTTLHYQQETGIRESHSDWEMLAENSDTIVPVKFLTDMIDSVAGVTIDKIYPHEIKASELLDPNHAIIPISWITDLAIDNIVVTINSKTVKASYLTIAGSNLQISQSLTMIAGDILRVYKVSVKVSAKTDNWFTNNAMARSNFASVINDKMSNKLLASVYSNYTQYIDTDDIIFDLTDWYLNDNYKTIDSFSYLSTTREFDMIAEYNKGIKSFKLKLPTHNEYYFENDNTLKLVNRSNSSLNVSFDNLVYPETSFDTYYDNAVGIQIQELMNMIQDYPDTSFINDIFFTMVNYLYTEKTYPDWLFKTSYIDLNLYNRDLKQYAVYQRDSEEDVLEYIRETKPYHVKVREITRTHTTSDKFIASTSVVEKMNLTLDFGSHSRYADVLYDAGEYGTSSHPTLYIDAGSFVTGKEYRIKTTGTTDFTLIGASDNNLNTKFTATGIGVGDGTATTSAFPNIDDGEYEQGSLISNSNHTITAGKFKIGIEYQILTLGTTTQTEWNTIAGTSAVTPIVIYAVGSTFTATTVGTGTGKANDLTSRFTTTSGLNGFDTGFVRFDGLEATILRSQTYTGKIVDLTTGAPLSHSETIDNTQFYVYDIYGRGYSIGVEKDSLGDDKTGTIYAFDGTTLTVTDGLLFDSSVSDTNKKLIAVQKVGSSDIEFMLYDKKVGTALTISNRGLYTGLGHEFTNLDTVYVLDTPLQIVLQDL